ncbi:dephospho-CoA kinase [Synechococcus sp. PCC 7502]|uniref:dephospho-CoA kinase n=1 Tax=Synechococcus sp. PCC 7502 TaxID=1173263 RepID=UPI00029FEDDC|nr:dephospho-CoA kinase [Synechococcus sp. PCC 7502]AFY73909.1 dephospho-CoA kinase [Synechococcus sp. PCC 7502]
MRQRVIGLTGGIATGKTVVAKYLSSHYQLPVLDADVFAREAITPSFLETLHDRYGSEIFHGNRTLNRKKLGEIIFSNPQDRVWLESQIHPFVRDHLKSEAQRHSPDPVVMVIPLLFEAGMQDLVTETWVVSCSSEQELKRLMERDQLDIQSAQLRINSQMPMAQKVAIADYVLDNSRTLSELFKQVDKLIGTNC